MEDAEYPADQIALIAKGKIVAGGDAADIGEGLARFYRPKQTTEKYDQLLEGPVTTTTGAAAGAAIYTKEAGAHSPAKCASSKGVFSPAMRPASRVPSLQTQASGRRRRRQPCSQPLRWHWPDGWHQGCVAQQGLPTWRSQRARPSAG